MPKTMSKKFTIKTLLTSLFAAVLATTLAGCGKDYAAKCDKFEIKEETITNYVQNIREGNNYDTEDKWGQYLANSSLTPSTLRDQLLDNLIQQEIVRQLADEKGCPAKEDEIDSTIKSLKESYGNDEKKWTDALKSAGMNSEDEYRNVVRYSTCYTNLKKQLEKDQTLSDEDLLTAVKEKATTISGGKKSSHILFAATDKDTAQKVLDQLNAGTIKFEDAARKYSTDTASANEDGNVGWDKELQLNEDYQKALDKLGKGQLSGLVTTSFGIHIIKCTDTFTAAAEITDLKQVPDDIVAEVKETQLSNLAQTALQDLISKTKEEWKVDKTDMPDNVPYNIDMSKYKSDANDSDIASSSSANDSADSSDSAPADSPAAGN